jgi:hypothetical protein
MFEICATRFIAFKLTCTFAAKSDQYHVVGKCTKALGGMLRLSEMCIDAVGHSHTMEGYSFPVPRFRGHIRVVRLACAVE